MGRLGNIFLMSICIFLTYPFCYAGELSKSMEQALKLKENGDIAAAVAALEKARADESLKQDGYTQGYLQTLTQCLQGDPVVYLAVVQETSDLVKEAKNAFLQIADELKTGQLSRLSNETIKEMKEETSRLLVTHNFCVPPPDYEKLYQIINQGLYHYSKAWGGLYKSAFTEQQDAGKDQLMAEALANMQRGNDIFAIAGTLLKKITEE